MEVGIALLAVASFLIVIASSIAFSIRVDQAVTLAKNALEETSVLHCFLRRLESRLEDVELLAVSTSKRLAEEDESTEGGNSNAQ